MPNSITRPEITNFGNQGLRAPRVSACLRSIHNSIDSIAKSQRIGNRFRSLSSRERGVEGISNPLAVVLTIIATAAGAACETVTGEVGPPHMALEGAPVQLTANMS